jgi:hypothetical protein
MRVVFISYRRDDTAGEARALYKDLVASLGADSVFMDVDNIALGRDFREALQERLESCDVMLALMGDEWLDTKSASGKRRLDDPDDFVRQEIAAALKRNIPVTPVLLQGVQMPSADDLPEDLESLAYRNGFEIRHRRWESDVQEMIVRLGLVAGQDRAAGHASTEPEALKAMPSRAKGLLWGGSGLAVFLVVAVWLVFYGPWLGRDVVLETWDPTTWDATKTPAYVVVDSAWKTKMLARKRVAELSRTYGNSGFIWIPDFDSLSGAQFFQVYVGPFQTREEAEQATCDYITKFHKKKDEHYAVLVSAHTTNQDRVFCGHL